MKFNNYNYYYTNDTNLKIKLLDKDGIEIITKSVSAYEPDKRSSNFLIIDTRSEQEAILLDSVFFDRDIRTHVTNLLLTPKIEIPNEDFKKVKKIEVSIE